MKPNGNVAVATAGNFVGPWGASKSARCSQFRPLTGGDRHSGRIEAHGDFIRELIAEQGDMTLVEVQARLIERGTLVGIGTVHRFFVRHGITRKKRPGTRSSRTVPTS